MNALPFVPGDTSSFPEHMNPRRHPKLLQPVQELICQARDGDVDNVQGTTDSSRLSEVRERSSTVSAEFPFDIAVRRHVGLEVFLRSFRPHQIFQRDDEICSGERRGCSAAIGAVCKRFPLPRVSMRAIQSDGINERSQKATKLVPNSFKKGSSSDEAISRVGSRV
jgi:hypothetical protein